MRGSCYFFLCLAKKALLCVLGCNIDGVDRESSQARKPDWDSPPLHHSPLTANISLPNNRSRLLRLKRFIHIFYVISTCEQSERVFR